MAKIQTTATRMRRVGGTISGYIQRSFTLPSSTELKNVLATRTRKRAMTKTTTTVKRSGRARSIPRAMPSKVETRYTPSRSPQGRV